MGALSELPSVHNHRLNHNPSKLPSYRVTDLLSVRAPVRTEHEPAHERAQDGVQQHQHQHQHQHHSRNHSDSAATTASPSRPSLPLARPLTFPGVPALAISISDSNSNSNSQTSAPAPTVIAKPKKRVPASHSRNGLRDSWKGPPTAMLTQKHSDDNTSDWVAKQSTIPPPNSIPATSIEKSSTDAARPQQSKPPLTPLIPPFRAFRSSRRSTEMNATPVQRSSMDQDNQDETLRVLEGFDRVNSVNSQRPSNREQEEQNSDDSDPFLKLAREEALMSNPSARGLVRRVCTFISKTSFPRAQIN